MANIFTLDNTSDFSEKMNIDELYEKKRHHDLKQLELYNKILNRIHVRIKTTAKQKIDEHFCWYVVPEIMIGVPKFDQGSCIAYIMDKLKDNGFSIRYIHPNALMISWNHWVPTYVRNELKKKTGLIYDEYGNKVEDKEAKESLPIAEMMFKKKEVNLKTQNQKKFTPINSYKPQGNLVYNDDLLNTLENKIN